MNIETSISVAEQALSSYGLPNAEFRIVKSSNNVVFQVTSEGKRYALRIHRPGYRRLAWIEAELEWLGAIGRNTALCVPQPAASLFHGWVGDESVYCTLLTWLDGQQKTPAETTEADAHRIGVFVGLLHEYSSRFEGVTQGEMPVFDIVARLEDRSAFYDGDDGLLPEDGNHIVDLFVNRIRIVIKEIENSDNSYLLLHTDLIWKNVLHRDDTVCAIDFDDCAYGLRLYDLAPLLLGYLDEKHYPALKEAVWAGYTSILPQPDSSQQLLETLIAARFVLSIQWIAANHQNPAVNNRAQEIIASRIQRLKHYLDTGKLERGEIII